MGLDELINKGKQALSGKDGKIDYKEYQQEAQDAYKTFNSTDGDYKKKATAVYDGYQQSHKSDSSDSKTESTESK